MADQPLSDDELARLSEGERKQRALQLSQEVARRYDPARLARLFIADAGRGEKLDEATRQKMERTVGGRFGDVRILRGPFADAVTRRHNADAVTIANSGMILVREGTRRADPNRPEGQALLAHELTHVRQAQRGMHFALESGGSQGAAHEREAEQMERQVLQSEQPGASEAGRAEDPEATRQRIIDRVFELIAEGERLAEERLGRDE